MSERQVAACTATILAIIATLAAPGAASAGESAVAARRIVVSIPDRRLAVIEGGDVIDTFPVAVGAAATPSPTGTFTIVNRVSNPTYYRPGRIVAPGPRNPLGTRWIGLSQKGYGIHGTNDPASIGLARSQGCVRLRNADVERLFELVRAGDVVELHAERSEAIAPFFAVTRHNQN